ncbi:MAG: ribonuclease catalytic domain-containing protein [Treponema sp.]|nr:ribonuclease catalytic domain-containing protein [Treponema sp.]
MISENALVIYKTKPAIVKERSEGKFSILLSDGQIVKVRDKDIEFLHPGPIKDFNSLINNKIDDSVIREAWELLRDDNAPQSLKEISAFIFNDFTPSSALYVYELLKDGLYFSGTIDAVKPRSADEVSTEESKRNEKQKESGERSDFLCQLKAAYKKPDECRLFESGGALREKWSLFLQDVEALAYGKTQKSRTMRDMGLSETPEDAHALLLKTGYWTKMVNPHPPRYGLSFNSARIIPRIVPRIVPRIIPEAGGESIMLSSKPEQREQSALERRDLCYLASYAIDSPWSNDPDDAVSIEKTSDGQTILYVHVADPASVIDYDSPAEKEARDRGATLYLPEGASRMLAEECIPMFALGLSEISKALTFKMIINEKNAEITGTEIFPSLVKVTRVSYEQADIEIKNNSADFQPLCALFNLSREIFDRRAANGAVNIEYFDVHITLKNETVDIEVLPEYRSSSLVKECMIAAGEGASAWAASRGLAFPYISQEVETAGKVLPGYAGFLQLRKSMKPRVFSVKPGRHQGLGLESYLQVTSPLRRYNDLLSHIQIYNYLRGGKLIPSDEISARIGYNEAALSAVVHAERASENHWKMVYLSDKKDSVWDAVAVENKGRFWTAVIPSIALEIQVSLRGSISPNDNIKLVLKSANIPKGEAAFVHAV